MPKRILQGTVVATKAEKTISVSVVRKVMHPVYKKYIKKTKNLQMEKLILVVLKRK